MSVQLVILGLLSEKPRHGYELRQEVERRLYATYINLSGGSLYYNLGQLERAGYVEKTRVEQKGRYPARRIYQLTADGAVHFRTELRKLLFDAEGRERVFDPFNTALAFSHFVDEEELREALTTHLKWAQERAAWVRVQQEFWHGQEISLAQRKIIEHGLAHFEAEIRWLRDFLRDLDMRENSGAEARAPSKRLLEQKKQFSQIIKEDSIVEGIVEGQAGLSVLDMIQQGWYITYPLIIISIITITVICERLWALRGLIGGTLRVAGGLVGKLQKGDFKGALTAAQQDKQAPSARIFRDVISQQDGESLEYLSEIVEDRRFEEIDSLKGAIWILGTVAVSAPFIGLLGTVIGIIKSFHNMSVTGSGGFTVVAGGISEALIATALGLAVAIVAVIFYNYFQTKLERIESAMTIASDRVLEAIRLGRKAHGNV